MAAKRLKPAPKPTNVVCEACGLKWDMHGDEPTLETCVRLLKAELGKRPKSPYAQIGGASGYGITWNQTGML